MGKQEGKAKGNSESENPDNLPATAGGRDVSNVRQGAGPRIEIDPVETLQRQIAIVEDVYKKIMRKDHHYGVIPRTKKPTLLKPGAEKLISTFRLAPKFRESKEWLPDGHLSVDYVCELYRIEDGKFVGEGVGSCSTLESRYRYRWQNCGRPSQEYWNNRNAYPDYRHFKDGKGGYWLKKRIENKDIADQYNTVKKIGKKRAEIDAVLTVTGVSDVFTQDAEDFHDYDADPGGENVNSAPPSNSGSPKPASNSGNGRPLNSGGGYQRPSGSQYVPPSPRGSQAPGDHRREGLKRGDVAKDPRHIERVAEIVMSANEKGIDAGTLIACLRDSRVAVPNYVKGFDQFRYFYDDELDIVDAYIHEGEVKTGREPAPSSGQSLDASGPPSTTPPPAPPTEAPPIQEKKFDDVIPPTEPPPPVE